jgi:hypothetical protein
MLESIRARHPDPLPIKVLHDGLPQKQAPGVCFFHAADTGGGLHAFILRNVAHGAAGASSSPPSRKRCGWTESAAWTTSCPRPVGRVGGAVCRTRTGEMARTGTSPEIVAGGIAARTRGRPAIRGREAPAAHYRILAPRILQSLDSRPTPAGFGGLDCFGTASQKEKRNN